MYQSYNVLKKAKREDLLPLLDEYYKSIGRDPRPQFENYSLDEIKKCIILFQIELMFIK